MPLFIAFTGSDWCGWCKMMDKEVFSTSAWRAYAQENLVLAYVDSPQNPALVPEQFRARNEDLKEHFKVTGFPTYVVMNGDVEIGRLGAARKITPEVFIQKLKQLLVETDKGFANFCQGLEPATVAGLKQARAAKLQALADLKSAEETVEQKTTAYQDAFTAAFLLKLGDRAGAYKEIAAALETVKNELETWLATKPERTTENTARFEELRGRIQAHETQLAGFE
jgi:thiol-disulfide isomerase/thioredoxin